MPKYLLYYKKPQKKLLKDILIIIIIITLIIIVFKIEVYEVKELTALYEDKTIKFPLDYQNIDMINNNSKIKYQDKTLKIENYKKGEPYLNNGIAYEDIEINTELETDSQIVNLKIYYQKERIIKKIKKIIGG